MPSGFPGRNLCYLTSTAKSISATLLIFLRHRASYLMMVLHATKQCVAMALRRRCDSHYPGGFALHQPHYYTFSSGYVFGSYLYSTSLVDAPKRPARCGGAIGAFRWGRPELFSLVYGDSQRRG